MADRTPGDLRGTGLAAFLIDAIASTAVRLKNVAGVLRFRNKADDADVAIVASKLSASGDVIELNEDAASSGADWPYTLQRPSTGKVWRSNGSSRATPPSARHGSGDS